MMKQHFYYDCITSHARTVQWQQGAMQFVYVGALFEQMCHNVVTMIRQLPVADCTN